MTINNWGYIKRKILYSQEKKKKKLKKRKIIRHKFPVQFIVIVEICAINNIILIIMYNTSNKVNLSNIIIKVKIILASIIMVLIIFTNTNSIKKLIMKLFLIKILFFKA